VSGLLNRDNRANASRRTDDNVGEVRMTSVSTASHQSYILYSIYSKHILNGWKIKYSGGGVPVDDFIYRVEALTRETLGNLKEKPTSSIGVIIRHMVKSVGIISVQLYVCCLDKTETMGILGS